MQPVNEVRLVLHHVMLEAMNTFQKKFHCFHHQWPPGRHQYPGIQHFQLHDLNHLTTLDCEHNSVQNWHWRIFHQVC
jgi:hypothetical protein